MPSWYLRGYTNNLRQGFKIRGMLRPTKMVARLQRRHPHAPPELGYRQLASSWPGLGTPTTPAKPEIIIVRPDEFIESSKELNQESGQ